MNVLSLCYGLELYTLSAFVHFCSISSLSRRPLPLFHFYVSHFTIHLPYYFACRLALISSLNSGCVKIYRTHTMHIHVLNNKWNITSISNKHSLSNALFDPIKLGTYCSFDSYQRMWVFVCMCVFCFVVFMSQSARTHTLKSYVHRCSRHEKSIFFSLN